MPLFLLSCIVIFGSVYKHSPHDVMKHQMGLLSKAGCYGLFSQFLCPTF